MKTRVIKKETEVEVRFGDVGTYDTCIVLGPSRESNAALIATAYELLEVLEFIVNDCPEPGEDAQLTVDGYNKACAVIRKAKQK